MSPVQPKITKTFTQHEYLRNDCGERLPNERGNSLNNLQRHLISMNGIANASLHALEQEALVHLQDD
jgi:hypothetical protein